jgi:transcriptional regulator with XRE-family HTH domain
MASVIGAARHRLDGNIGELVRDVRKEAGLSQAELAAILGTKQSVVSRWERGHETPRIETLVEILRACGFEADLVRRPRDTGVDRAQIRAMLRRSPEGRLREGVAMYDFVRKMRRAS